MSSKPKDSKTVGGDITHQLSTQEEFPFKNGIGMFQSSMLLLATIGLLEVGFIYSTILLYILMTVMFYEMLQVQARHDKEQHITVKSIWIQWYFYIGFQIYMISNTWLTEELV